MVRDAPGKICAVAADMSNARTRIALHALRNDDAEIAKRTA
jgi:hypothetical protein